MQFCGPWNTRDFLYLPDIGLFNTQSSLVSLIILFLSCGCSFGEGCKDQQVRFTFCIDCYIKYPFLSFSKFSTNYILCLNVIFPMQLKR